MSTVDSTVAQLDRPATLAEVDEFLDEDEDLEDDDKPAQSDLELPRGKRDGGPSLAPGADETAVAVVDGKEAERLRVQALVPWEVLPANSYNQRGKIDQWADDWGAYPRTYRAYSRGEWTLAIAALADAIAGLAATDPDYQRRTGLYVEEHANDLLLVRAKAWQLVIQIPSKASTAGKKVALSATPGRNSWDSDYVNPADALAELLTEHVAGEHRDVLLDLCCQYLRDVRIRVNRAAWAAEHPDLAHLLEAPR